jgi:hypothetical protein
MSDVGMFDRRLALGLHVDATINCSFCPFSRFPRG